MQIVVHLVLDEVADILVHADAVGAHGERSELNLGLTLEHRLLNIDGYGSHEAVADVGIFKVFVEKLLYRAGYVLLERALVSTALRGVLSVYERVILLAILVGVCERNLDVFALEVYYRVDAVGGHRVVEQVFKSVAAQNPASVVHDGQSCVQVSVVAQHRLHEVVVERVVLEERVVGHEVYVSTCLVLRFLGLVALQHAALEYRRAHCSVAVRPHLEPGAQRVDGLDAHTVESDALLERLRVVFTSGV